MAGERGGRSREDRPPSPLVLSRDLFNRRTDLASVGPLNRTERSSSSHVAGPDGDKVPGHMMVEQARSIDYRARDARRIGQAPHGVLAEGLALLAPVPVYQPGAPARVPSVSAPLPERPRSRERADDLLEDPAIKGYAQWRGVQRRRACRE